MTILSRTTSTAANRKGADRYARGNPARWWKSRSCGNAARSPAAMFISPFRRLTSAGTLMVLILLILSVWYVTNPKRIARLAENLLSNVLGGKVTVKSARLSFSGTLLLSGVELRTEGGQATSAGPNLALPIFTADQIEARFDWLSLLSGQLHATQLSAIRPTLYLVEDKDDQRWNYEKLRTRPAGGGQGVAAPSSRGSNATATLPVIVLRDARMQWAEVHGGVFEETAKTIIDGQLTPDVMVPNFYRFQISQRAEVNPTAPEGETRELPGGASVSGTWDLANNQLTAATQKIPLSDMLMQSLPRQVREWCAEHHLQGNVSQLRINFDNDDGLVLAVDLDHVAMHQTVTPEPWLAKAREAIGAQTRYDLPLEDVSGTLIFGVSKPSLKVGGLRGVVLGYRFVADGEYRGMSPESPFEFNVKFPNATLGETYPALFTAFRGSQDLLQRVAPHGNMDVAFSLKRLSWNGPLFSNGSVVCHDARMRFAPFPYPLDHVNGEIDFNEQLVTFNDVTARGDEMSVHMAGVTGTTRKNRTVNFKVWSDDAVFDDRIGNCLPLKFKPIWDEFSIHARGSFVCNVTRDVDDQKPPAFAVDVQLTDGQGYARSIPYRFKDARGHLFFGGDRTEIDHLVLHPADALSWWGNAGTVVLDGVVKSEGGKKENEETVHLTPELKIVADIPVDRALLKIMPVDYAAQLRHVSAGGRLNFEGTLARAKSGSEFTLAGLINWHDGTLDLRDQHLKFYDVSAIAQMAPGQLDIAKFAGTTPENLHLEMSGLLDLENNRGNLVVAATGSDVSVPAEVPPFLPENVHKVWEVYRPSGKLGLNATLAVRVGGAAGAEESVPADQPPFSIDTYAVKIVGKGARMAPPAWPESVEDIRGSILATPERITFEDVSAKTGPLTARFDGSYQVGTGAVHMAGTASSPKLVGKWASKLPQALAKYLETHHAGGSVQVDLTRLERAASGKPWEFEGAFALTRLTADGTAPISADDVHMIGAGAYSAGGLDFKGTLTGTNIAITGKNVDTVSATLLADSKDHTVRAADLSGSAAGGALQGNVLVQLDNDGRYEANLVLSDASLSKLLLAPTATAEEKRKVSEGVVSATLAVQETFGAHADRTGRGELVVRDGKIYNLPLAMGLMQIVTLRLPVAKAFDHASMSYYLRDDRVTFERILLESAGINLAGAGTMSLQDKSLDMNFVTLSPNELQIPLISPLIREFRNELLEINVTGTADNPKITPVPLNAVGNALQAILPHARASD